MVVTSGYMQGLGLVCRALAARRRAADRDRGPEQRRSRGRSPRARGWSRCACRSTARACVVDGCSSARASDAVVADPGAPAPDRASCSRRSGAPRSSPGCASAARSRSRTTTTPSTATTGPRSARCRGWTRTASSTRARPARPSRPPCGSAGWSSRPALLDAVRHEKALADQATARIEQHALADFIGRGELDRHLRRMRARYRARRDAMIAALADELPGRDGPRDRRRPARDRRAARRRSTRRALRGARRAAGASRSRRSATTGRSAFAGPADAAARLRAAARAGDPRGHPPARRGGARRPGRVSGPSRRLRSPVQSAVRSSTSRPPASVCRPASKVTRRTPRRRARRNPATRWASVT